VEIYVGNLPWSVNDDSLGNLFKPYGAVSRAKCMVDRETGRSRGFGFVVMDNATEAAAAIKALNGADCDGRALRVNEAQGRPPGGGGDGGGFGGGRREGGGGGYGGGRREGGGGGYGGGRRDG
jgi:RNA recognition motif-containing protein